MIPDIFDNPLVFRMGWALLHFLWQATLIALALKGAFLLINLRHSGIRYALSLATLIVMALLPLLLLYKTPSAPPVIPAAHEIIRTGAPTAAGLQTNITSISGKEFSISLSRYITPLAPWITLLWIPGMSLLLLKTAGGILQVQRLKRKAAVQGRAVHPASLHNLAFHAGIPEVPVMNSNLVSIPTVAGWIKPVVLLPGHIYEKIDHAMLTALAAHEFAHIRRRDSFMNLLQTVIEDLFFFHPAAWWVSACIRREREACCDDEAVAICGDALLYARALSQAEQFRSSMPVMALNSSPLLQRVRRLTAMKASKSKTSVVFISFLAVSFILALAAGSVSLAVMPPLNSDPSADQPNPETLKKASKKTGTHPVPAQPAGSNIVGGMTGSAFKDSAKPIPPPKQKTKVVVVNPDDFITGFGTVRTDTPPPVSEKDNTAVPGGITGGMASRPNGPVAPPPQITLAGKYISLKRIRSVDPVFPEQAVKNRITGKVVLKLNIDTEGIVSAVKVLQGDSIFTDAAVHAVGKWVFTPTLLNGQPIPTLATVSVVFTFDKDGTPKVIY